ncbi:signal recognition particle protein [Paraliomyxa miuraensis]|uniref:signal recognition particle protein n=1 Tax=Paraliomyxa miuraensis TaxID=376150 RepID=UPI002258CF9F|nr:signal recognition particle receptor subunit alpha [Paraliomyxa miuraensis]MCX4239558.1 signal recognition particle protein Srp54 [Paraliomyxa miuraensis]
MFETISKGFRAARERITGRGELTEDVIDAALKDVRMSLLEADVEFRVVKRFLQAVKDKALGEQVQLVAKSGDKKVRVRSEDHFVRICHEELVELMGPVDTTLETASKGVTGIMMVGLQGSGKTTTTGKLARRLQKEGNKVLLVACDVYRPAAVRQLQVIGEQLGIEVFAREGGDPVEIATEATAKAQASACDFVIYDTAGRLTVDEALMTELDRIKAKVRPANILLVIDAMIGQDAVNTAKAFDERIDVSGVVLTKLDGDARGGSALSIKAVTGKPIKFLGMGETLDRLDEFRPEGLAGRILGMGDLVGLMQDFQEVVDEEQAAEDAAKMLGGSFTMDDFLGQIKSIQKMGSLKDLMDKMPLGNLFGGEIPDDVMQQATDDRELIKIEAMIRSMTKQERAQPDLFLLSGRGGDEDKGSSRYRNKKRKPKPKDPTKMMAELPPDAFVDSRVDRVARGSGRDEEDVRALVGRFIAMRDMFGMLGDLMGGGGGLLSKLPGVKQMKQLGAMRKLAKNPDALQALMGGGGMPGLPGMGGGGMPGMPGLPGMGGGMPSLPPGMSLPGLPAGPSGGGGKSKSKDQRKKEKKAKRKNRRK